MYIYIYIYGVYCIISYYIILYYVVLFYCSFSTVNVAGPQARPATSSSPGTSRPGNVYIYIYIYIYSMICIYIYILLYINNKCNNSRDEPARPPGQNVIVFYILHVTVIFILHVCVYIYIYMNIYVLYMINRSFPSRRQGRQGQPPLSEWPPRWVKAALMMIIL